jgi:hypothetical protein
MEAEAYFIFNSTAKIRAETILGYNVFIDSSGDRDACQ